MELVQWCMDEKVSLDLDDNPQVGRRLGTTGNARHRLPLKGQNADGEGCA